MKKTTKVDSVIFNGKKYELNEFISKTFPGFIVVIKPNYTFWDRILNTRRFKRAIGFNINALYEELLIQFKLNLLKLKKK